LIFYPNFKIFVKLHHALKSVYQQEAPIAMSTSQPPSPLARAYLHFLALSRSLTAGTPTQINANERALLEAVVLAWHQGQPLSVRQAIAMEELGSPATLHKRLSHLRDLGLVADVTTDADRRTKRLAPTEATLSYYAQLGEAMRTTP
jgi:hypothetical protein